MMLKKVFDFSLIFIALFYFNLDIVLAYQYANENNESLVKDMINEIYDSKQQYEDLAGGYNEIEMTSVSTSNLFWWPIGSIETTEKNGKLFATGNPSTTFITSSFDSEEDFRNSPHKALDIRSSGHGVNYDNVIASKSGIVVYPMSKSQTHYEDNGSLSNTDGGKYGNYVMIQHSDGMYTLYAHLAKDSITVLAGDTVEQGQVIAKLGHSGQSTGPHLHFEIRTSSSRDDKVNPLKYVSAKNPRPFGVSISDFSLTTTTLTREEFSLKMNDYCTRTKNGNFCNNFAKNADIIYDASKKYNVNPELVVVTAGTEQSWKNCGSTNNYWGIGITNGKSCSAGPHYSSLSDGIAGYAGVISNYMPGGKMSGLIESTYDKRLAAGADPNGIGHAGTYAGMQMIYSSLGSHIYGSSGAGGYYYMDPSRANVTTIYSTHEEFLEKCYNAGGEHSPGQPVTAWEQSRYTIYQMSGKNSFRQAIFGI